MATISGEVRDENNDLLADCVVRAYRRDTGALLVAGVSGDGSPEEPSDADYASVSLLLHCDGTDGATTFTDTSPTPKTVTAYGAAHIETDQSQFGGASGAFDGSSDYLLIGSASSFYFSGAFTMEAWIYPTNLASFKTIIGNWLAGIGYPFIFGLNSKGNLILLANNSATPRVISTGTLSTNAWAHVVVQRSAAGTLDLYINGVADGTASYATAIGPSGGMALYIGACDTTNHEFTGYIDELRITTGIARYAANFTPPTAAFLDAATIPAKPLGEYTLTTDYTGEVQVVALDPDGGTTLNDLILRTTPV